MGEVEMENIQILAKQESQISRLLKSISDFNTRLEESEIIKLSKLVANYWQIYCCKAKWYCQHHLRSYLNIDLLIRK